MKRLILRNITIVFCLLFLYTPSHAKIWTVTKDLAFKTAQTDLQTTIDGASSGDTIYVYEGNWGDVNVSKTLSFFGTGYFLKENAADSLSAVLPLSNIGNLTFKTGSAGSFVTALNIGGITITGENNIVISNNKIGGVQLTNSSNNQLKKNNVGSVNLTNSINNLFSNNIIGGNSGNDNNSTGNIFKHNYLGSASLNHTTLINNIIGGIANNISFSSLINNFFNSNSGDYTYYDWAYHYNTAPEILNVSSGYYNISVSGNKVNKIEFGTLNVNNSDHLELPVNSPARGAGLGGVDCGPFGGDDPYHISGLEYLPTIIKLSAPYTVSANSGLNMRVIVKSNK